MARVRDMILGSILLGAGSGGNSGMTIELSLNTSTYVLTANLKDKSGTVVSTSSIDLPLESTVVSGSYDNTNKKLVLTLVSGETIDIPVGDLIDGLQSTIQYSTIPTANADYVGKIIQYVGTTDSTYTNGYFYACVSDGQEPATYTWTNLNVQPGGESPIEVLTLTQSSYGTNILSTLNIKSGQWYIIAGQQSYISESMFPTFKPGDLVRFDFSQASIYYCKFIIINNEYIKSYQGYTYGIRYNPSLTSDTPVPYSTHTLYQNLKKYLPTDNAASYTPTADSYNPSTAKYSEKMVEAVAPVYDATSTYDLGDFVSYQGKMYKCTTTISTAEAWDATHWTETNVVENLSSGSSSAGGYYTFAWDEYGTITSGTTFDKLKAMYDDIKNNRSIMSVKYASTPQASGYSYSGTQAHTLVEISGIGSNQITLRHRFMALWGFTGNNAFNLGQGDYGNAEIFIKLNISNGELVSGEIDRWTNHIPHVYLSTINTIEYTPTGNYHPATKKYVDDQIGSINTILATLTTPSNGGE